MQDKAAFLAVGEHQFGKLSLGMVSAMGPRPAISHHQEGKFGIVSPTVIQNHPGLVDA
jgi:hypothetical protein